MKELEGISHDALKSSYRLFPHLYAQKKSHGRWIPYRHLVVISRIIAQAVFKGNGRIIINVPPRHGKSMLISLWTPIWFLELFPTLNVLLTTYAADYAGDWGYKARNEILANPSIDIQLKSDSKARSHWQLEQGGEMITAGVGGPITGRGGHLVIVDDPVKNLQEALSPAYQKRAIGWFDSTLYTRLEPDATIIVLMTRWHENDLTGYLIDEHTDDWQVVRFPATAEENDPLGREVGEALCPERFDQETLEKKRKAVGSVVWNGLYQQRPSALEGGIVKRKWIQFYRKLPENLDRVIQSWDMAFKDTKKSDYVVGQVWGIKGANLYLIDQVRDRMDFPTTIQSFISLSSKYRFVREKIVEEKANGPAVIATLKSSIPGIIPYNPDTSKEGRLMAASVYFEAENVFLPDPNQAPWVHDLIEELVTFPNAAHDDQVDALSQAILRLTDDKTQNVKVSRLKGL